MNKGKITRLAFAIVFLCFLLSTFVSLWSLRIMAKQNAQELSKTIAAGIYDTISADLTEPVMVAKTMANDYFLIEMLRHEQGYGETEASRLLTAYLSGIRDGLDCQSAFLVSSGSMRYFAATGAGKIIKPEDGGRDKWYAEFMDSGKDYALDIDLDEFDQDSWTVFVDARIQDDVGKLLGVCGVGIRMTGTQALFIDLEKSHGVKINLVAPDGQIMVDTDQSRIERAYISDAVLSQSSDYAFHEASGNRFTVSKYVESLGWYLVVTSDGSNTVGQFLNVIILNLVLCVLVMLILILAIRVIIGRTRALAQASFRDQTTQLLNRRAFEEAKAELTQLDPAFTYITADVNGLKTVNDTLGHLAGDELIKGAADCMQACFGKYGDVYRIGGDEFAAMLRISEAELDRAMARLEEMTAAWSGEKVKGVSISCGWATSREFPSQNISEIQRISDERMYAAKEAYYQRTGKDRRRK